MAEQRRDLSRAIARLRFTDEWVGLVVLAAVALLAVAAFEAGVLNKWLHPGVRLVILLPQTGTDGLALGADVEVLGTHAGTVRRIKLNPDGNMYAVTDLDQQAEPFVRRDSKVVIRRRFAVAGATYVDISRGSGAKLDWDYAVLQATTEPDPIATITHTIDQIRADLLPTLASAHAAMASLQASLAGIEAGHGTVGALLTSDDLLHQVQGSLAKLDDALARLPPIEGHADALVGQARSMVGKLDAASAQLRTASRNLPAISNNARNVTADLPALLTQTQVTVDQLRKLIIQLRGSWLLGGGKVRPDNPMLPPDRLSP